MIITVQDSSFIYFINCFLSSSVHFASSNASKRYINLYFQSHNKPLVSAVIFFSIALSVFPHNETYIGNKIFLSLGLKYSIISNNFVDFPAHASHSITIVQFQFTNFSIVLYLSLSNHNGITTSSHLIILLSKVFFLISSILSNVNSL